jgi:hypothetical protein
LKLVKLLLISIVFLFLLVTAFSLLIPSQIRISRATNIAPNKDRVWSAITDTGRWKNWYPAFMEQNARTIQSIQITPLESSDTLFRVQLQQGTKRALVNGWQLYRHASTDSLTLQWFMDFRLSWYPWQKFGSLFYESTYGTMMEEGLANLKKLQ